MNQVVQTDQVSLTDKKIPNKIKSFSRSGTLRRNMKDNKKLLFKKKKSSNVDFEVESDMVSEGDFGEETQNFDDKIYINKELMEMVKNILKYKSSRGSIPKKSINKFGKLQNTTSISLSKKGSRSPSKSSQKSVGVFEQASLQSKYQLAQYSIKEVQGNMQKLYEKLLICLDNPEMMQRFNNSIDTRNEEDVEKFTKLDILKTKLDVFKQVTKQFTKILHTEDSIETMYMQYCVFVKSKVEQECKIAKVDPNEQISLLFKDVMIEEQIDLDEIKKICNLSQKHEILKEIAEEISAGMSDHEKSLSKAISFGTIYTLDNESVVAPDTKRDKTPFENQGIREKCEVPTVETKKEVADFQMQWNVETIDQ